MSERPGFTLIEVIVSMVLLAAGVLLLQTAVVRMLHQVGGDTRLTTALQLVDDRLNQIQTDPQYDSLVARYNAQTESNAGGNTGLTRVTAIVIRRDSNVVGGQFLGITDWRKVTVTVSGTGLSAPISRTVTMAAP